MREILHAWHDSFHWWGRLYMLGGRVGEIVSMRETPSQCGRVGSPGKAKKMVKNNTNVLPPCGQTKTYNNIIV